MRGGQEHRSGRSERHPEQFVYHNAGLDGAGQSSYIDEVLLRDRDANTAWHEEADSTREERVYYCQNWRADVSVVLTDTGKMVEWVKYSSYGVPFGLPAGDADSDGDWDATDAAAILNSGSYDVRQDAELDGDVDSSDAVHAHSITGAYQTLGRGVLSNPVTANRRGYTGYEYDPTFEGAGRHIYHVRHRVYDADVGRWTRRDPLGYVDGMSMYAYVRSQPITLSDALGLAAASCQLCTSTSTPDPCNGSDGDDPDDPRYQDGYRKGKWCLRNGASTWTDCMLCCTEGISHPDDPFGWGCRKACEEGSSPDPDPPPFVPECWAVQPVGPGPVCNTYAACDSYLLANARCFCQCMGSDPWSNFVRACLACHYRRGETPDDAHEDCYAEADRRYPGQRPIWKIAKCATQCWAYQAANCVTIAVN